jgi:dienelactone hydrolase
MAIIGVATVATARPVPAAPVLRPSAVSKAADAAVQEQEVQIPQRGGGSLAGRVTAPAGTGVHPLIVALPGGLTDTTALDWATSELAGAGYVVLAVDPARDTPAAHDTAARSAIDFAVSAGNPLLEQTDTTRIGVAGWSIGGRALTLTQTEDYERVDALVAWDNLASSENGDAGSPSCRADPAPVRQPRVPAMGQASETCPSASAEAKKTAYEHWRAAGVPAMQVVLAGCGHTCWGQAAPEATHAVANHYTLAWFDRWLKADPTATDRLLATEVDGRPLADVLSSRFASAAYLDALDCPDLRAGCAVGGR